MRRYAAFWLLLMVLSAGILVALPQATQARTATPPAPAPTPPPTVCPASGCLPSAKNLGIPVLSTNGTDELGTALRDGSTIIGIIAGVVSVVFLVLGGIKYTTSTGDSAKVAGAKNTILYAILGLIVSIIAPLIVGFVIQRGPQ